MHILTYTQATLTLEYKEQYVCLYNQRNIWNSFGTPFSVWHDKKPMVDAAIDFSNVHKSAALVYE